MNDQAGLSQLAASARLAVIDLAPAPGRRMVGSRWAYVGLSIFIWAYFIRPEDWMSAAGVLPAATVGGLVALVGLMMAYTKSGGLKRRREVPLLLMFLGWFIVLIPFSSWPGGSYQIFDWYIWKIALLSIVFINVVDTTTRLRSVLVIQVVGVTMMSLASYGHIDTSTGRLTGVSEAFGNSNDLAALIAITLPIGVYLCITAHGGRRLLWLAASLLTIYILILTLSRTGFLAFVGASISLTWYFLVKQRKYGMMGVLAIGAAALFVAVAPSNYRERILSIVIPSLDVDESRKDATGSREERIQLMRRSIEVTAENPFMGVGPGQMVVSSGTWHVSHNTFLQFTTESGIPGLVIFVLLLRTAYRNLSEAERQVYKGYDSEGWILIGILRASLNTFIVAAFFSNFGYQFFTYFLIAYTASVNQIVTIAERDVEDELAPEPTR